MKPFEVTFVNKAGFLARMLAHKGGLEMKASKLEQDLAEEISLIAQDLAPVDTGKTKESIRPEPRDGNWAVVADRFGDLPEVPVYLEFGTRISPAQPFMVPAADIVIASGGLEKVTRSIGGLLLR